MPRYKLPPKPRFCPYCQTYKDAEEFNFIKSTVYKQRKRRCKACDAGGVSMPTIAADAKEAIIARLGFMPALGCEQCPLEPHCRKQGVWVDPPCLLPDSIVQAILQTRAAHNPQLQRA